MFIEICFTNFYYVHYGESILIKNMNAMFHFIIFFFKRQSYMRENRAVPVLPSVTLLLARSFCKKHIHTEKKAGHRSRNKNQNPHQIEYKE